MEIFLIVLACIAAVYLAVSVYAAISAMRQSVSRKGVAKVRAEIEATGAPPSPYRSHTPAAAAWWDKQQKTLHELVSFDGERMVGWSIAAKKDIGKTAVVMHGHDCGCESIAFITRMFLEGGYNVVVPDMRANNDCGGDCYSFGAYESEDALLWVNKAIEIFGSDNIAVYGNSLGAGTACMLSAKEALAKRVRCIISDCSFTTLRDEIAGQMALTIPRPLCFLPLALMSLFCKLRYGFFMSDANPLRAVAHARVPIFFVHGALDTFVPTWMSEKLYAACSTKKELYIVPEMRHGEAYFGNPAEFAEKVFAFCDSCFE